MLMQVELTVMDYNELFEIEQTATLKGKNGAKMAPQDGPHLGTVLVPLCKVVLFFSNMIIKKKTAPTSKVAPFSREPFWLPFFSQ